MRPASQRFFIHSCIYLRILIISYLATFLGTNSLSVLMCRNAVNQSIDAFMCKLRYTLFRIYFRLKATMFDFSSPWRRPGLAFVPLCCSMQNICGFRWSFAYFLSAMSNLIVSDFCHFDFRLNSDRIVHSVMLLLVAVTSASSKTNAATLNLLPKAIYAPWFNGQQVYNIFTKISPIPPSLINNAYVNSWNLPFVLKTCYI